MRHLDGAFWWAFSAFIAIVLMHVIFWLITPAGEQILAKNENVTSAGMRFFGLQRADRSAEAEKAKRSGKRFEHIGNIPIMPVLAFNADGLTDGRQGCKKMPSAFVFRQRGTSWIGLAPSTNRSSSPLADWPTR